MSTTTAPDAISDLDVDTFVRLLDDAPDLPCAYAEAEDVRCPNPARWGVVCRSCGYDIHACDYHRQITDHAQHLGSVVTCVGRKVGPYCGHDFPNPMPWRLL